MRDSRFRAKTYVGSGGMASVYKAFDQALERDVAIKEMAEQLRGNEDVMRLFLNEARKMAAVRHINVVQVYDVIDDTEVPTIIMEYLGGGSLASRLGPGRLPEEDVVDILQQVVAGLSAIHGAGLVHRDLKPENILEDKGVYKITDFGVAMSGDEDTLPFVTSKYAAPEVLVAPEKIGAKSDLYSLGIMAMELLLGPRRFMEVVKEAIEGKHSVQLPAIKDSTQAFWQQWVASSIELPPLNEVDNTVSAEMGTLLQQLTRRDQNDRIGDCQTLIAKLAELKRHDRQRVQAPTEYSSKMKRRLEEAKKASAAKEAAAATTTAVPPRVKKKSPFWFKAVVSIFALLLVGVAALLLVPPPAPAPGPLSIETSAEAAAVLQERMPQAWPLLATLDGIQPGEAGSTPAVAIGSPLTFSVNSERAGYLLMVHLGADNSLRLIYPMPDGTPRTLSAATTTPIGSDLGLVATEPLGAEWFVFVTSPEPHVPPEITGREAIEDKAALYALGGEESAGRSLVLWLLESFEQTDAATAVVPIEVVSEVK